MVVHLHAREFNIMSDRALHRSEPTLFSMDKANLISLCVNQGTTLAEKACDRLLIALCVRFSFITLRTTLVSRGFYMTFETEITLKHSEAIKRVKNNEEVLILLVICL